MAKETLSNEKLTGNASVVIHLKNVNDNSPIFNQSTYVFQVDENAEVETVVGVVQVIFHLSEKLCVLSGLCVNDFACGALVFDMVPWDFYRIRTFVMGRNMPRGNMEF